jgi:hypothetical protein
MNALHTNRATQALFCLALPLCVNQALAQERAAYIYPSWEAPKVVLITAGTTKCKFDATTAIHTNGVLRIYTYRTTNGVQCDISGTGGGRQTATPEQVLDLRSICAGTNCEEPVQRV